MPRPLCPQRKNHWYTLDRKLGGPQSRSGCCDEEKNSQTLLGLEPPNFQPIAQYYTTEVSRLPVKEINQYEIACLEHIGEVGG
jgi:hypothetical protein